MNFSDASVVVRGSKRMALVELQARLLYTMQRKMPVKECAEGYD